MVAGSYHEAKADPQSRGFPHENVSRVFTGKGEVLLTHVKLRPMRTGDATMDEWVHEAVAGASRLRLLFSDFGLLTVGICLDFCEAVYRPVAEIWKAVGLALVLVPSMGTRSTNNAHRRRAEELSLEHGTVTIVASQEHEGVDACGLQCGHSGDWLDRAPVLLDEFLWQEG